MQKLVKHLPPHFSNINELNELFEIEEDLLHDADEKMNTVRNNNFIQTADVVGIGKFEELFGIIPSPNDTLEFRRFRVLNRMAMKPPFTTPFLREKLNNLLPNYTLTFDYNNYTMYVESYIENASYFDELNITLSIIKPCNIVIRYKPLIRKNLLINSETTFFNEFWNYKLNGSWHFNDNEPFYSNTLVRTWNYHLDASWNFAQNKPFAYEEGRNLLKAKTIKSFTSQSLSFINNFISQSITKVILTNTNNIKFKITEFITKNNGIVEYSVPSTMGDINNIKLYSNDILVENYNTIWVSHGVDANIKHEITLLEGVL